MSRKTTILLFLVLALMLSSWSVAQIPDADEIYSEQGPFMAPMEPDPGIPDTASAETKTIASGATSFSLRVSLYNDEELGGFNLPITWNSPDIICDSVSFDGSRVAYVSTKLFSIDNVNQRLQAGIVIFFEQYLQPGSGMVYTAYFSFLPGTPDQVINFDSTFYPPGGNFALTLANGFNIVPQYVMGTVTRGEPSNPEIAFDPADFSFGGIEDGANPLPQTLNISNSGTGDLEWTLSKASGWLGLNPTVGTNDEAVEVTVNISGLAAGTYEDTIVVTANAYNSPQKIPVLLTVDPPPPIIHLDPTSIEVTAIEGSAVPSEQINVTNIGGGVLNWTAAETAGWLSISPAGGVGDGIITVDFDLTGLAPGTYNNAVTVTDPAASNSPQTTTITLIVQPPPPTIQLDPILIDVSVVQGATLPSEQISVTNTGGGELNWTASNTAMWLSLDPTSGVGNGIITVNFNVGGLMAGTYVDTITVSDPNATNNPQITAVMLTVEPPPPSLQLNPVLITVTATEGGSLPSEPITVTNVGGGELNWTASNQTGWLSLDPTAGSGDGVITLDFDLTGLTPGEYRDTVAVIDAGADNSPQITVVILTITAEAEPVIGVSPASLIFSTGSGGSNPPSKTFAITNLGGGELNWTVAEAEDWLMVDPMSGTGDGVVTVSVDKTGLAEGTYPATITVSDPAAANSPVTVEVTLMISDAVFGKAVISPDVQHYHRAYSLPPKQDTVYIGDFGVTYYAGDIDPASILVNGFIAPISTAVIPSHPDFDGDVLQIVIEARPFILDYPFPLEPTVHEFTVFGQFGNMTSFEAPGEVMLYSYTMGDANGDGIVNIGDPIYLIEYIFRDGVAPYPLEVGDANGDGKVDVGDVRYLVYYIFKDGPAPIGR